MRTRIIIAAAAVLGSAGCASSNELVGRSDLQIVQTGGDFPAPGIQDLILEQRSYVVGPFDKVAVDVYGVPELNRTVQVDATGTISLPLVGIINASGQTTTQLATAIGDRLRGRYVRDPQVIVTADTVNQMVTVTGEVNKPGLYPVTGRMTLERAIATSEGLSDLASTNYIVVFRRVNKQQMAALYDLRAIRQGIYPDPEIYANDVVLVGESASRRTFGLIAGSAGLLTAPLIALLQ